MDSRTTRCNCVWRQSCSCAHGYGTTQYHLTSLAWLLTCACTRAGGVVNYWGFARSTGQGAEPGTPKVAAQPQKIPAALFLGTSVTTCSAGWGHTAFVTGSMQIGKHNQCAPSSAFDTPPVKRKSNTCMQPHKKLYICCGSS